MGAEDEQTPGAFEFSKQGATDEPEQRRGSLKFCAILAIAQAIVHDYFVET